MPPLVKKELLLKMSALKIFAFAVTMHAIISDSEASSSGRPPILKSVPATSFTCAGRPSGYYADMETGCQAYHMCGMSSRKYSYLCPSYTLFHQKFMVCDHWKHVDCSTTEKYYDLNLKIGKVPDKATDEKKAKTKPAPVKVPKEPISKEPKASRATNAPQSEIEKQIPRTESQPTDPSTALVSPAKKPSAQTPIAPTKSTNSRTPIEKPLEKEVPPLNSLSRSPSFKRKGRGSSSRRFLFGGSGKNPRDATEINGLKFHPVVLRPIRKIFEPESFTIPPEILKDPVIPNLEDEGEQATDPNPEPVFKEDFPAIPTFLIPPLPSPPSSSLVPPPPNISTFLLPPPPGAPIVIDGPNQEKKTPLVFTRRGIFRSARRRPFSLRAGRGEKGESFFSSPSIRGNPDFFIPSPGLLPPLEGNFLQEESGFDGHLHHHRMTMTFPNGKHSLGLAPLALNPSCPQCHPAFLRNNQCSPCVIIK